MALFMTWQGLKNIFFIKNTAINDLAKHALQKH